MNNLRTWLEEKSLEEREHFLYEITHLWLEGGEIKKIYSLLSNYDFIEAKINYPHPDPDFGIQELIKDYNLIDDAELLNHPEYNSQSIKSLKLIQDALRLSAHIVTKDKKQLAGQLSGRLLYFEAPEIQQLLQHIPQTQTTCLRSLRGSLSSPSEHLISTLEGHINSINAVCVTPDGKYLISASSDNTVKVWDLNIYAEVLTFTGHSSSVNAVASTVDGKRVVSGASDKTVKIWNLETGKEILIFNGHSAPVVAVAIAPDGEKIASASDSTIKIWDLETGKEELSIENNGIVTTLAFLSWCRVISASDNGNINVWSLNLARGEVNNCFSIRPGPNDRHANNNFRLANEANDSDNRAEPLYAIAVTPDNKWLISGSKIIRVWELEAGKKVFTLKGHNQPISALAVTPDGRQVISASFDNSIRVWGIVHETPIFNQIEEQIYTVSGKESFTLTEKGNFTLSGHDDSIYAITLTSDGKKIISASKDKTLKVWNLESREKHFKVIAGASQTYERMGSPADAFCPSKRDFQKADSARLSSSEFRTLKQLADKTSRKICDLLRIRLQELDTVDINDQKSVNDVTITPDGNQVLFGLTNNIVTAWDLEKINPIFNFATDKDQYIFARIKNIFAVTIEQIFNWWLRALGLNLIWGLALIFWIIIEWIIKEIIINWLLPLFLLIFIIFVFSIIFNFFILIDIIPVNIKSFIKSKFIILIDIISANIKSFIKSKTKNKNIELKQYNKYSNIELDKELSESQLSENKKIIAVDVAPYRNWLICVNKHIHSPLTSYYFLTVWDLNEKNHIFDLRTTSQFHFLILCLLIPIASISFLLLFWEIILIYFLSLSWLSKICFWFGLSTILILLLLVVSQLPDSLTTISITPDGKYLISGSIDKTIKIWNLESKKLIFVFKGHRKEVTAVNITPDGKYLISGSKDKTIKIWNLETRKQLFTLTGHGDSVNTISVTTDVKYLISGSKDKTIKIWNLENREEIFTFTGHTESINAVKVTSNGKLVISASSDKTIQVWDFASRKIIAKFTGESAIKCCAVAPDDVTIVAGEESGRIHFLRLQGVEVQS